MEELKSLKIEQTSKNYFNLKNNRKNVKFKLYKLLCPFGIDNEYGNLIVKLELEQSNSKHLELINQVKDFENKLKEQFHSNDEEWKSLISVRENNNIFIEAKVKIIKNKLLTTLTFEDNDSNYLKTMYELGKNFYCDVILEIPTLWDFRKDNEENVNKIGLILNLFSIHVY